MDGKISSFEEKLAENNESTVKRLDQLRDQVQSECDSEA